MNSTLRTPRWYYEMEDSERAALLKRAQVLGIREPLLLRGATVVTGDATVGDFVAGDVLIVGDTIIDIGPDLGAAVADGQGMYVDMRGMILMPGLIDAHRHCWQGQFRRALADGDIDEYADLMHRDLAPRYRPQDIYAGTLISLLGLLEGGVTTVLDYCHNSRSSAHSDAAFRAYRETGIRVVHGHAGPYEGEWERQWPWDAVRLRESSGSDLISVRLSIDHLQRGLPPAEMFDFARTNDFSITVDGVIGARGSAQVLQLEAADLLGPDVGLIHCTAISDAAWSAISHSGCSVTLATTSNQDIVGLGDGVPPVQRALDHGIRPALSCDVETCVSSDMFSQMRATLAVQRMSVSMDRVRGEDARRPLSVRDVFEFGTRRGAEAIGLGHDIGTLTPGKRADLVAIRGEDISNMPMNSATATVVQGADSSTVDTVIVGGTIRKWDRRLVGHSPDLVREIVHESRDYLSVRAGVMIDPISPQALPRRMQ